MQQISAKYFSKLLNIQTSIENGPGLDAYEFRQSYSMFSNLLAKKTSIEFLEDLILELAVSYVQEYDEVMPII